MPSSVKDESSKEHVHVRFPNQLNLISKRKRIRSSSPSTAPTSNHAGRDVTSTTWNSYIVTYSQNDTDDAASSSAAFIRKSSASLGEEDIRLSGVTLYSEFMLLAVVIWTLYLILPRGFRQFMCNAYPKRYKKSDPNRMIPKHLLRWNSGRDSQRSYTRGNIINPGGPSSDFSSNYSGNSRLKYNHETFGYRSNNNYRFNSRTDSGIVAGRRELLPAGSTDTGSGPQSEVSPVASHTSSTGTWDPRSNKIFEGFRANHHRVISPFQADDKEEVIDFFTPAKPLPPPSLVDLESLASFSMASPAPIEEGVLEPSPVHPNSRANHRVPSQMVLSSTLTSLREPGIRLYAHGTQCEPRRIWIQLDVHKELVEWRTENNKSKSGDPTSVSLGSKHTIALRDVIYVDVGKTTAALQLLSEDDVSSDLCFSILTKNGSLDLNAGNKLERDALISCFCLILDTIYLDNTEGVCWRDLYIAESSVASESTQGLSFHTKSSYSNIPKRGSETIKTYKTQNKSEGSSDSSIPRMASNDGIDLLTDV